MSSQLNAHEVPNEGYDLSVPKFIEFNQVLFKAEHAIAKADLVFHFYRQSNTKTVFWLNTFRDTLSDVAQSHFCATYPRLQAAYTEEMDSWWLRACGLAGLDPSAVATRFLTTLHAALAKKL